MKRQHRTIVWAALAILAVVALLARLAGGWHEKEHFAIAHAAVEAAGDDLPAFFRTDGPAAAGYGAVDPDVFKNRAAPHLHHAEQPEHFHDLEYFADEELPSERYAFLKRCYERGLDPRRVGLLPYAITEWTERLTMAMALHRRWPDDPHVRRKCLVYAGLLAHYAGDLWQPLHTTIHYDGRVEKAGDASPRTGVHAKMDGLLRRVELPAGWDNDVTPRVYDDVWAATLRELRRSHARVDRVYALEDRLPGREEDRSDDAAVRRFAVELARHATAFTASLYRTAWAKSAKVKLPDWLDRERMDALVR